MKIAAIKIKSADFNKATVRSFSRSAWEAKQVAPKSLIQLSKKRKEPKYKNRFHELEQ